MRWCDTHSYFISVGCLSLPVCVCRDDVTRSLDAKAACDLHAGHGSSVGSATSWSSASPRRDVSCQGAWWPAKPSRRPSMTCRPTETRRVVRAAWWQCMEAVASHWKHIPLNGWQLSGSLEFSRAWDQRARPVWAVVKRGARAERGAAAPSVWCMQSIRSAAACSMTLQSTACSPTRCTSRAAQTRPPGSVSGCPYSCGALACVEQGRGRESMAAAAVTARCSDYAGAVEQKSRTPAPPRATP